MPVNHSKGSMAMGEEKSKGASGMSGELIPAKMTVGTKSEVTHRGYKGGRVQTIGNTESIAVPQGASTSK